MNKHQRTFSASQQNLNVDNNENIDLNVLIDKLGQCFEQDRLSLKFKDEDLEKEYQKQMHTNVKEFGMILVIESIAFILLYAGCAITRYQAVGNSPHFIISMISSALFIGGIIFHYFISRKNIKIALQYANLETLICLVTFSELELLCDKIMLFSEIFSILTALLASISLISYCQKTLLFSYIICGMYTLIRSYFSSDDIIIWIKFNLFSLTSLAIIYTFSRRYTAQQRLAFQQQKNANQLLDMFHNLIKVYHDGIIITQGEQIILKNKQIHKIFEVDQENTEEEPDCYDDYKENSFAQCCQSVSLIDAFRLAVPSKKSLALNVNKHIFENIWDYILQSYDRTKQFFLLDDSQMNSTVDGIYFKLKQNDRLLEEGPKVKKLQVFSQQVQIGQKFLIITTVRDMSHWLELEKQKHLSTLKTLAFASAAHEFRNPLSAITSSLEILSARAENNIQDNVYFQTANNCSKLMLFLVNDILDFAQLESNKLILNYQNTNIREILSDCINVLLFKAQSKGIELNVQLEENFPSIIMTDGNRLKQILINLISNAIKYTEVGSVKVIGKHDSYSKIIKIIVQDTGVGIEQDKLQDLFSAFTKIMKNRELNKEGVGLGLTISKNLVEAFGGDIDAQSIVNFGSIFTISLPFEQPEDSHNLNDSASQNRLIKRIKRIQPKFSDSQIALVVDEEVMLTDCKRNQQFDKLDLYLGCNQNLHTYFQRNYSSLSNTQENLILEADSTQGRDLTIKKKTELNFRECECQCPQILLVDDEPFNLLTLTGQLGSLNLAKVDTSQNGQEALKMIEQNFQKFQFQQCINHRPYQLVLTDNRMPKLTGVEMARRIRDKQSDHNLQDFIKVVLISGDQVDEKSASLFDGVLQKPFNNKDLRTLMNKLLII